MRKKNGAIELVIKPYDHYQTLTVTAIQSVKNRAIFWIHLKTWAISMMV